MTPTHRRVAVLMGAGVLLAVIAGWTVWAASSSSTNHAGYTADAADQTATADSAAEQHRTTTDTSSKSAAASKTSHSGASATDDPAGDPEYNAADHNAAPQVASGYAAHNDPYLPPHAVVGQAAPVEPTKVYRPTNIVPAPAAPAASTEATTQVQSTPAGSSTAPTDTPHAGTHTAASQPSEPVSPVPTPSPERPQGGRPASSESEDPVPSVEQTSNQPVPQTASDNLSPSAAASEQVSQEGAPAPERITGKEEVAGYPSPQQGFDPRQIIDRVTKNIRP